MSKHIFIRLLFTHIPIFISQTYQSFKFYIFTFILQTLSWKINKGKKLVQNSKTFFLLKKERKKEKARKELRFTYIKLRSLSTLSSVSCPRNVWPSSRRNTWTSFHCRTQRPWKLGNLWSPTCHPPANTRDILNRGWRHLLTGKIDECSQVVIRKPCFLFPQFVLEKCRE